MMTPKHLLLTAALAGALTASIATSPIMPPMIQQAANTAPLALADAPLDEGLTIDWPPPWDDARAEPCRDVLRHVLAAALDFAERNA